MHDDTISTDPKLHAEARKAAAETNLPKLPYDPKAVAREEFDRIIDKRYYDQGFDALWATITAAHETLLSHKPFLGALTEAEYRQFFASLCYRAAALKVAAKLTERSYVLYKAAAYAVRDRLGLEEKTVGFPDMRTGMYRSPGEAKAGTCILHPNGCPESIHSLQEFLESITGRGTK